MLRSRSRKSWKGRSREPEILESSELESDILPPTPQLVPAEMVQFLWKLIETENSCCAA